jgi:hypothetical protein
MRALPILFRRFRVEGICHPDVLLDLFDAVHPDEGKPDTVGFLPLTERNTCHCAIALIASLSAERAYLSCPRHAPKFPSCNFTASRLGLRFLIVFQLEDSTRSGRSQRKRASILEDRRHVRRRARDMRRCGLRCRAWAASVWARRSPWFLRGQNPAPTNPSPHQGARPQRHPSQSPTRGVTTPASPIPCSQDRRRLDAVQRRDRSLRGARGRQPSW